MTRENHKVPRKGSASQPPKQSHERHAEELLNQLSIRPSCISQPLLGEATCLQARQHSSLGSFLSFCHCLVLQGPPQPGGQACPRDSFFTHAELPIRAHIVPLPCWKHTGNLRSKEAHSAMEALSQRSLRQAVKLRQTFGILAPRALSQIWPAGVGPQA